MRFRGLIQPLIGSSVLLLTVWGWLPRVAAQSQVAVVSAASFREALAPNAIAAAFGSGLATGSDSAKTLPLPTTLAGTTVRINGQLAPLFFVAPGQVNFLVPENIPPGTATIEVRAANGTLSQGQFQVRRAAPGIFTANGSPPAGYLLRGQSQTLEQVAKCDASGCAPASIDLGTEGETLVPVCFATGLRGATATRVVIGGKEYQPAYAGPQGDLVGLDQVNFQLPRELIGRGRVELLLAADGVSSNPVELEFAHRPGTAPPVITGLNVNEMLAGERITITGSGFALTAADNLVRIGTLEANVISATATQLVIETPLGVRGGVSVKTSLGEGVSSREIGARTSISGFVTDAADPPRPLRDVSVTAEAGNTKVTRVTGETGSFVLPDVPPGLANIKIDRPTAPGALPYPALTTKMRVQAAQDNRFAAPVALQTIDGPGTGQSGASLTPVEARASQASAAGLRYQVQQPIRLETNGVVLEISGAAQIAFPPGIAPGKLNLTVVNQSRVPAQLPAGLFSQRIAQITPFGATITPGAKLAFPNLDGLPAGTQVKLFRFDKERIINQQEAFVEAGTAVVTADGKLIETDGNAIKEASYYFAAAPQQRTTAIGRVVDGTKPVRDVIVQVRGQNDFTDGNGGFTPRDVSAKQEEVLQAEVSYQRPNGGVIYTLKTGKANANGITNFGAIPVNLINPNQPPNLTVPEQVILSPDEVRDIKFIAFDPEDRELITLQLELVPQSLPNANPKASFAIVAARPTPPSFEGTIRLTPKAVDIGEYALKITVQDNGGDNKLAISKAIAVTVRGRPGPFALSAPRVECDTSAPSGPVVRLTWGQAERADSYDVYRNDRLIAPAVNGTAFDDKEELTAGANLRYRVTARNGAGTQDAPPVTVDIPGNVCAALPVTVSLDPATVASGAQLTLPVRIGDLTNRNVIAYEFELAFDPAVLQFQGLDTAGTISNPMTVLNNTSEANGLRVLRVGAFIITPLAGANRVLLRLRFSVTGPRGASTPLVWQKFWLNEDNPPVTKINGRVTVS